MKKEEPANYLIFARKFRPQTFDDVIGQEPITTTLKNAIAKGRIAQSFLFTGSRGVGKTSTARILAKALNCEQGPSPAPCNQCSICDEITQGRSLDVLEIDGASNRGIDEIRSLRENVKFKPARGRYKVYIIDEVHMLTGEAFNALLKTLEEPPAHVKFIFATTEAHKVPLTILSRCQRFNFRRIPTEEIVKKLKEIAKNEKIKVNDKTLFLIAKSSEGSLRDGESLLDQLTSFGDGEVKETDVTFSLGLTDEDVYFSLLESLKTKESRAALRTISKVADDGKDLIQFSKGLLELFRNLLILELGEGSRDLIEGTEDQIKRFSTFKGAFSREELLFSLTLIQQLAREIRWSETPRFLIEACVLKIANRADLRSIDEILKELKSIQQDAAVGAGLKPAPTLGARAEPQKKKEHNEVKIQEDSTVIARSPEGTTKQSKSEIASLPPDDVADPPRTLAGTAFARNDDKPVSKAPTVTLEQVGRAWPELLERVKTVKMSCGTYLSEAEPLEVVNGLVVFGLPAEFKFHKEALEKQDNKELVRSTLNSLLGREVNVSFVVTEPMKEVTSKRPEEHSAAKDSDIITSALDIFEGSKVVKKDP